MSRICGSLHKCHYCILRGMCGNLCYFETKKIEEQYEQDNSIFEECSKLAKELNMDIVVQVLQRPTKEFLGSIQEQLKEITDDRLDSIHRMFKNLKDYLDDKKAHGVTPDIDTVIDYSRDINKKISYVYYVNILLQKDRRDGLEDNMQLMYFKDGEMYSYDTNELHPYFNR